MSGSNVKTMGLQILGAEKYKNSKCHCKPEDFEGGVSSILFFDSQKSLQICLFVWLVSITEIP